jgi:hypothetical protein
MVVRKFSVRVPFPTGFKALSLSMHLDDGLRPMLTTFQEANPHSGASLDYAFFWDQLGNDRAPRPGDLILMTCLSMYDTRVLNNRGGEVSAGMIASATGPTNAVGSSALPGTPYAANSLETMDSSGMRDVGILPANIQAPASTLTVVGVNSGPIRASRNWRMYDADTAQGPVPTIMLRVDGVAPGLSHQFYAQVTVYALCHQRADGAVAKIEPTFALESIYDREAPIVSGIL